jgi:hypothetical protein
MKDWYACILVCYCDNTGCLRRNALILSYIMSTMKRLDFGDDFKNRQMVYSSGVKVLLRTTEVQSPGRIFRLSHVPPFGGTNVFKKKCIEF